MRLDTALTLLLAILCLSLTACGSDDKEDPDTQPDTDAQGDTQPDTDAQGDTGDATDVSDTSDVSDSSDAADAMDADVTDTPDFVDDTYPYQYLSSYGFFEGPIADHTPADRVMPYVVNSTLYADMSEKFRFIYLPVGTTIEFSTDGHWVFPEGAVVIKTFYYPVDFRDLGLGNQLIETRLLVRRNDTWEAQIYLWNDAQTEAERFIVGTEKTMSWVDADGATQTLDYIVPDRNQCKNCHEQSREMVLLGPKTTQMNRDYDFGNGPENQLAYMESESLFAAALPDIPANLPSYPDHNDTNAALDDRARAYLDANCSHCHNPDGSASSSGLNLAWEIDRDIDIGICRRPFAAGAGSGGHMFDIVPGSPDTSIMVFRMSSVDSEIKMPELPTRTVDADGLALIRDWITAMPADDCQSP